MNVRYINPFIIAVEHVFKTMVQTTTLVSKPRLKDKDELMADVSAIIGISGRVTGSVTLCFGWQTAVRVAGQFAGTELSVQDGAELADALGELTNMVAGQARANLPESDTSVSLPKVVVGDNHRTISASNTPVLLLPCDCSLGRFHVEVTLQIKQVNPFAVAVGGRAQHGGSSGVDGWS
jgi:chemotaxis protein CheX